MNKRRLHHYLKHLLLIKPVYFLLLAMVFGVIGFLALRSNNQHMGDLRQAVYTADKQGSGVEQALQNLRNYVYAHMNTNLADSNTAVYPPIQLKYTYDRLVRAESDQVAAANAKIYTNAQAFCEQQNSTDFSGRNRVPCISQYVTTHGTKATPIADSLYKFDFASPTWSPDLAGWTLVATCFSLVLACMSFAFNRWYRHHLA